MIVVVPLYDDPEAGLENVTEPAAVAAMGAKTRAAVIATARSAGIGFNGIT